MSGFKINRENITVEYFGTSNTLKLSIKSEDFNEQGNKEYRTDHIWIEPHTKELDYLIEALQKTKELL